MLSGERAGLVIYTFSPVRLLLLWRRGSFGFLDFVFFHVVTWPLEFRNLAGIPRRALYVTRGGSWKLERDEVPLSEHWVSG